MCESNCSWGPVAGSARIEKRLGNSVIFPELRISPKSLHHSAATNDNVRRPRPNRAPSILAQRATPAQRCTRGGEAAVATLSRVPSQTRWPGCRESSGHHSQPESPVRGRQIQCQPHATSIFCAWETSTQALETQTEPAIFTRCETLALYGRGPSTGGGGGSGDTPSRSTEAPHQYYSLSSLCCHCCSIFARCRLATVIRAREPFRHELLRTKCQPCDVSRAEPVKTCQSGGPRRCSSERWKSEHGGISPAAWLECNLGPDARFRTRCPQEKHC